MEPRHVTRRSPIPSSQGGRCRLRAPSVTSGWLCVRAAGATTTAAPAELARQRSPHSARTPRRGSRSEKSARHPGVPALKAIYAAPTEQTAEQALDHFEASDLGQRYPAIVRTWRSAWPEFTPYLEFPPAIGTVVYSTNMVESINSRLRKASRNRGHFSRSTPKRATRTTSRHTGKRH
ncbi:transposase [Streptomyces sp. NPDC057950]|uniref:transposase n=1 Tax=Streptomyces sp. NPDC057950 TaxID=3346288 RepID=UPI0036E53AF0